MKNVLIIYPHWPPSNLVGVHRVRLVANNLSKHGWHPIVLTVHEDFYEEPGSPESVKLVNDSVEVVKVSARQPWSVFGKRLVGDIGLRAYQTPKNEALICVWRDPSISFGSPCRLGIPHCSATPSASRRSPLRHRLPRPLGPTLARRDQPDQPGCIDPKVRPHLGAPRTVQRLARHGINRPYFQGALDRNPRLGAQTAEFQLGLMRPTTPLTTQRNHRGPQTRWLRCIPVPSSR